MKQDEIFISFKDNKEIDTQVREHRKKLFQQNNKLREIEVMDSREKQLEEFI